MTRQEEFHHLAETYARYTKQLKEIDQQPATGQRPQHHHRGHG